MPNTTIGQIAATAGGAGAGLAAGASWGLGLGGPIGGAIGAGVGALIGLIGDIGSGRRTANSMTGPGGPQNIINQQLQAIAGSGAPDAEKAQATQVAWQQFIQATNQFAAQGPEYAQVAKQALFQTPALTQTVQSLMGGINPLSPQFTSQLAPSIPGATPQSGITAGSVLGPAAAGAAGGFAGGSLFPNSSTVAAGAVGQPVSAAMPGAGAAGGASAAPSFDEYGNQIFTPNQTAALTASEGSSVGGGVGGGGGTGGGTQSPTSLLQRLLPNLFSSGTSILGGILGANAAGSAAGLQSNAALQAAQLEAGAGTTAATLEAQTAANALAFNKQVLAQQQTNAQPWINAGTNALTKIGDITSTPFTLPTAAEAEATPGYQFQLQQGQQALAAYEKASGTSLSGGALKDINNYAQGAASTNYQNVVGNKLQAYNANLNPQLAVAGLGQVSTGNLNQNLSTAAGLNANTSLTAAGQIGQIGMTTASNVANLQQQAAQSQASGYVGGANQINSAIGQVGSNITSALSPGGSNGTISIQQLIAALQSQHPANA